MVRLGAVNARRYHACLLMGSLVCLAQMCIRDSTGMLVIRNKKPYVFEAAGPVKYTPLKQWIAHGEKGKYLSLIHI